MGFYTGMAAAIAAQGVVVEGVPGWETRGSSAFNPGGVTCHWTAGPRGTHSRPSLNVVVNGRPGISGPLANVYLARDGVAVMVAAGRANHAGLGGYRGLVGNSSVFGIEAECGGDGDWTPAQRVAYPRVVAGLLRLIGRDAGWAHGHHEWAPTRKIDIRDYTMDLMRSQVANILSGHSSSGTSDQGRPTIAEGSNNAYVGELQRFLGIPDDNIFGAQTKQAVMDYQRRVGLDADGIVGPATWAVIEAALATPPEEQTMRLIQAPYRGISLIGGPTGYRSLSPEQVQALRLAGVPGPAELSTADFDHVRDSLTAPAITVPPVDVDEAAIVSGLVGPLTAALSDVANLTPAEVETAVRKALSGATINPAE